MPHRGGRPKAIDEAIAELKKKSKEVTTFAE
jgi:hypothetical protein